MRFRHTADLKIDRYIAAVVVSVALAGCTAGQTPGPPLSQSCVTCPSYSRLQFAVGTANLFGSASGLNVVSTLRQPDGTSALGVDTPTITGPFTFETGPVSANNSLSDPYATFPGASESLPESLLGAPAISGTPQSVVIGTPACDTMQIISGFITCPAGQSPNATTLGESGGIFAMGLAPYNALAETAQSYSYQPYAQPLYDTTGHFPLIPWGGPPAFDPDKDGMGTRDGLVPLDNDSFNNAYFLGVGEGVTAFENINVGSGTYTMSVQFGVAGPGGAQYHTITASAALNSTALLPNVTAPVVTPDANGDGGASVAVTVPAGVTEALVQIIDWGPGGGPLSGGGTVGNCHGPKGEAFAPVYYTLEATVSGTINLPTTDGPNTKENGGVNNLQASPSICSLADNQNPPDGMTPVNAGDNITVQMIGFDYPDYEAAVSLTQKTVPQAPTIVGASGQSDITISAPVEEDYPSYTPVTIARTFHPHLRHGARLHARPRRATH